MVNVQDKEAYAIEVIEDHFGIYTTEAKCVLYVIEKCIGNGLLSDIDDWIAEAKDDEETKQKIAEGEDAEEATMEYVTEQLRAALMDYEVNEGRGHTGDVIEVEYGREEWAFASYDDAEKEAEGRADSLVDDMLHDTKWVENHVVPSWERGETRQEFVKGMVRADGLGHTLSSYDGNSDEEFIDNTLYVFWRQN